MDPSPTALACDHCEVHGHGEFLSTGNEAMVRSPSIFSHQCHGVSPCWSAHQQLVACWSTVLPSAQDNGPNSRRIWEQQRFPKGVPPSPSPYGDPKNCRSAWDYLPTQPLNGMFLVPNHPEFYNFHSVVIPLILTQCIAMIMFLGGCTAPLMPTASYRALQSLKLFSPQPELHVEICLL